MSEKYNQDGSLRAINKYNWVMLVVAIALLVVTASGIYISSKPSAPVVQRETTDCPNCNGTGQSKPPELWIKYHPEDDKLFNCPMCGGTGVMYFDSVGGEGIVVLRNSP